jgi:hypothetical protein
MYRREYLTMAGGVALTPGAFFSEKTTTNNDGDGDGDSGDNDDPWCVTETPSAAAPLTPTDDPDFVVESADSGAGSATTPVEVHWRPESEFADLGFPFAYAFATVGGETVYLNSGAESEIDHYTLLHELAHSLGYRHGDGGVVNTDVALFPSTGDRSPGGELAASTRDVAQTFARLRHIDSGEWGVETLADLGADFAAGGTGISQLGIAGGEFAMADGQQREEVYFESDYDGFGGRFESGYRENQETVLTGRYYTEN